MLTFHLHSAVIMHYCADKLKEKWNKNLGSLKKVQLNYLIVSKCPHNHNFTAQFSDDEKLIVVQLFSSDKDIFEFCPYN